jgi:hypothetical protein
VTGGCQKLHDKDLHNLSSSARVGHIACLGEVRSACKILIGNPEGRDHSKDIGIDWRIILK